MAMSEAKHFAAALKNERSASPRSDLAAATYTICRAASSDIAMSASMN